MKYSFFYPQNIFLTPTYEEDWKTISEGFELLSQSFHLNKVNEKQKHSLNTLLGNFDLLKDYNSIFFIDCIEAAHQERSFHLILLSINSTVNVFRKHEIREQSLVEYEFIALAKLKTGYGHVLMRPEMLSDKINELLRKVEIDIEEEPEFSKNYFVLSEDEKMFREKISHRMLKTIGKQKGLFIEIVDNHMLLVLKKRLSKEALLSLAAIMHQILESE